MPMLQNRFISTVLVPLTTDIVLTAPSTQGGPPNSPRPAVTTMPLERGTTSEDVPSGFTLFLSAVSSIGSEFSVNDARSSPTSSSTTSISPTSSVLDSTSPGSTTSVSTTASPGFLTAGPTQTPVADSDARLRQITTVAIAVPVTLGVAIILTILTFLWLRRRKLLRETASDRATPNVKPELPGGGMGRQIQQKAELDGTERHETEARECKQEMATDRGGGNRGNTTAFERLLRRLLGKTPEMGSGARHELETVERPQELKA